MNLAFSATFSRPEEEQKASRAIDRAETKLPPEFIATYKIAPFTTSFGREPTRFVVDQMVKFGFIGTKIAPAAVLCQKRMPRIAIAGSINLFASTCRMAGADSNR